MGKNILVQRRGRGFFIFRAPTHRRLHPTGYNSVNGHSTGFVRDLLHEVARGAPLARLVVGRTEVVPRKVERPEMACGQGPSNDRGISPSRWWKAQTCRQTYNRWARYSSRKKGGQYCRSPDGTG